MHLHSICRKLPSRGRDAGNQERGGQQRAEGGKLPRGKLPVAADRGRQRQNRTLDDEIKHFMLHGAVSWPIVHGQELAILCQLD